MCQRVSERERKKERGDSEKEEHIALRHMDGANCTALFALGLDTVNQPLVPDYQWDA